MQHFSPSAVSCALDAPSVLWYYVKQQAAWLLGSGEGGVSMKIQRALLLGTIGLSVALILVGGCAPKKSVLPDVETPAGDAQAGGGDTAPGMSDLQKTAQANSATATAAAAAEGGDAEGVTPTPPPPTEPPSTPTTLPTPVEPTADVSATVAPTDEPEPTAMTEPTPGTGEETTYVVQRGDTLYSIARRYGTTVQAIAARNGIANPSLISVGQKLTIPASGSSSPSAGEQTYVVKRGDNLFRIALRYNMSYVDLAQYNGIADPSRIYVGQVIRIPAQ
jgi:LysM repeat protein